MEKITNFSIFKVQDKKKPTHPDYRLSAKIGDKYVNIGSGWIKEGKSGKFVSVQMGKAYGATNGYYIGIIPAEFKAVVPEVPKREEIEGVEYPEDEIDPNDIPF